MKRHHVRWLVIAALTVALGAVPLRTQAGSSSDNLLDLASHSNSPLGFGLGVSPLHWELLSPPEPVSGATASESRMLGDPQSSGKAVSFDMKLRWPTGDTPFEPYVVLGPALFVEPPQEFSTLVGSQADPVYRLGAKAGAGFNWRLSRDATLFGIYDMTRATGESFTAPGTRGPATGTSTGYDVLYGVRFRY
jgi:hypothetical protein